jgi:hypothetical protein
MSTQGAGGERATEALTEGVVVRGPGGRREFARPPSRSRAASRRSQIAHPPSPPCTQSPGTKTVVPACGEKAAHGGIGNPTLSRNLEKDRESVDNNLTRTSESPLPRISGGRRSQAISPHCGMAPGDGTNEGSIRRAMIASHPSQTCRASTEWTTLDDVTTLRDRSDEHLARDPGVAPLAP